MAQRTDNRSRPDKHICIFELERKGRIFTGEVVCTVCGVYLSSKNLESAQDKQAPTPDNKGAGKGEVVEKRNITKDLSKRGNLG